VCIALNCFAVAWRLSRPDLVSGRRLLCGSTPGRPEIGQFEGECDGRHEQSGDGLG
jgi:hypothetical protein